MMIFGVLGKVRISSYNGWNDVYLWERLGSFDNYESAKEYAKSYPAGTVKICVTDVKEPVQVSLSPTIPWVKHNPRKTSFQDEVGRLAYYLIENNEMSTITYVDEEGMEFDCYYNGVVVYIQPHGLAYECGPLKYRMDHDDNPFREFIDFEIEEDDDL